MANAKIENLLNPALDANADEREKSQRPYQSACQRGKSQ